MKKELLFAVLILMLSLDATAAPNVIGAEGLVQDGQSMVITGSGFGSEGPEILLFENFESGVDGALLSESSPLVGNWEFRDPDRPTYSTSQARSGAQSMYSGIYQWSSFYTPMPVDTHYYVSYWFRYDLRGAPISGGELKVQQIWGTQNGIAPSVNYDPGVFFGRAPGGWGVMIMRSMTDVDSVGGAVAPSEDTWHHLELILRQSDVGIANGAIHIQIDGETFYEWNDVPTRTGPDSAWYWFKFFNGCSNFVNNGYPQPVYWIDDAYLSTSWARIELCDNADYDLCTRREVQIPTDWSDVSITLDVNQGSFAEGDTAYVFVVDSSGVVSDGLGPLIVGEDAGPAGIEITSVSGSLSHGEDVTIAGRNFGFKQDAAPIIWDDCSGTDIADKWYLNLNHMSPAEYVMRYTTPEELGRGVATAHEHVTRYAAGAHNEPGGTYSGSQVGLVGEIPNLVLPARVYMSYYFRLDPNWNWFSTVDDSDVTCTDFTRPTGCSNNFKLQYLKRGSWYSSEVVYLERVNGCPAQPENCLIRGTYFVGPTVGIDGIPGALTLRPEQGWYKVEHEFYITSDSSSRVRTWLNGDLQHDWTGYPLSSDDATLNWYVTALTYAIDRDENNWKYLNDLYVDDSAARVLICPNDDWDSRGNCEIQIPIAWGGSSITFTVNQGSFHDGDTAYIFVVDENGDVSPSRQIVFSGQYTDPIPVHPADTNSDGQLSVLEISAYISRWILGQVSMSDLIDAIKIWKGQ